MKRVLVVDDDEDFLSLLFIYLSRAGYEMLKAKNGLEAIEILKDHDVDMLIIDLMMPMMDGLRFLHWFRKEEKKALPVIVLTATEKDVIETSALEAGATAVLYKPIKGPEILDKLRQLQD